MNITGIIIAYISIQLINIAIQKIRGREKHKKETDLIEFHISELVLALGVFGLFLLLVMLALPHLEKYVGPIDGMVGYYFLVGFLTVSSLILILAYSGERVWISADEIIFRNMFYIRKTIKRDEISKIKIKRNGIVLCSDERKVLSVSSMYDNYMKIVSLIEDNGAVVEFDI